MESNHKTIAELEQEKEFLKEKTKREALSSIFYCSEKIIKFKENIKELERKCWNKEVITFYNRNRKTYWRIRRT